MYFFITFKICKTIIYRLFTAVSGGTDVSQIIAVKSPNRPFHITDKVMF